ncbi:Pr6Pr family membrane protein [Labedella populi]|uniref:Pr6Pr family membrane protein n=1 Tax=Labedella populi TaxID=2498850 RepID=UPI001FB7BF8A|nr:Pr6Pr family membrane protein [Labedella populi]
MVIAVSIVSAVLGQLVTSVTFWSARNPDLLGTTLANFFSFFTIQSNLAAAITLAIGSVVLLRGRGEDPRWFAVLMTSIATYMVTTGIVYNVLLRGIELDPGLSQPWSNEVVHAIAPAYLLLDRLFAPGRRPLPSRSIGIVVIFPLAWAAYTLLRAPLVTSPSTGTAGWYPYPFLDPRLSDSGYLSVVFFVVLLALVIATVGLGVLWLSRRAVGSMRTTTA